MNCPGLSRPLRFYTLQVSLFGIMFGQYRKIIFLQRQQPFNYCILTTLCISEFDIIGTPAGEALHELMQSKLHIQSKSAGWVFVV